MTISATSTLRLWDLLTGEVIYSFSTGGKVSCWDYTIEDDDEANDGITIIANIEDIDGLADPEQ